MINVFLLHAIDHVVNLGKLERLARHGEVCPHVQLHVLRLDDHRDHTAKLVVVPSRFKIRILYRIRRIHRGLGQLPAQPKHGSQDTPEKPSRDESRASGPVQAPTPLPPLSISLTIAPLLSSPRAVEHQTSPIHQAGAKLARTIRECVFTLAGTPSPCPSPARGEGIPNAPSPGYPLGVGEGTQGVPGEGVEWHNQ